MNNMFLCTYEKLQEYMYFIKSILIFFKTHLDDIFLLPKIHTKYFSTEIFEDHVFVSALEYLSLEI